MAHLKKKPITEDTDSSECWEHRDCSINIERECPAYPTDRMTRQMSVDLMKQDFSRVIHI